VSDESVLIPMDRLFAWHSAIKAVVMYPGMKAKVGETLYDEICRSVLGLEAAIGVVKDGQPDSRSGQGASEPPAPPQARAMGTAVLFPGPKKGKGR